MASVGATISGASFALRPETRVYASGGNIYWIGRQSTTRVAAYKASDPMSAFAAVGTAPAAEATEIEAMGTYQAGSVIHCVWQIASGLIRYASFDCSTDTWGTSEVALAAPTIAPGAGYTWVSPVVRSGGEVVVGHCAEATSSMVAGQRTAYVIRTATNTWTAPTAIDNGGGNNYSNPLAVLGASDRVHFFFTFGNNSYQRCLLSDNSWQEGGTFPSATVGCSGFPHPHQAAVSYEDSGLTSVAATYRRASSNTVGALAFTSEDATSAAAPTISNAEVSPVLTYYQTAAQYATQHISVDETTLHVLFADNSTQDLFRDVNSGSGWGTDTEEWDAVQANRVASNVFVRGANYVLGIVADNAGTVTYLEVVLRAADTTPPAAPTGLTATALFQ